MKKRLIALSVLSFLSYARANETIKSNTKTNITNKAKLKKSKHSTTEKTDKTKPHKIKYHKLMWCILGFNPDQD